MLALDKGLDLIAHINKKGYEAYIVGGAVRDYLLGLNPLDVDICTNATPEQIMEMFPENYPTGIKFGTVTVVYKSEKFEITTFRKDGEYINGRKPEEIFFTNELPLDLARRDLTINAMAMDRDKNIIDVFNGKNDLKSGPIRAVGVADKRFKEDALRILRTFRFSAKLGFPIERETLLAMKNNISLLANVSKDRIREEFNKILMTNNIKSTFCKMNEVGVFGVILKDIQSLFWENSKCYLAPVEVMEKEISLRWAMLLHPFPIEVADDIFTDLNFSNKDKLKMLELMNYHDKDIDISGKGVRKIMSELKYVSIFSILKLKKADIISELNRISTLEEIANGEIEISLSDLAVNGNDMMTIGLSGQDIGRMLNYLLDVVIEDPTKNKKIPLLLLAKDLL